jgi:energy-coupling factor transporter ATP-binding protein EcfA2
LNPPNTAELIILHVLLATASLVAASNPKGRMLILDESGNNLDGPNLTRVSAVLRQVAEKYGLTVVLACQDIYTDRVARYGAGMIQLLRPSPHDPLNAPPNILHGEEDSTVLEALMPYMILGRPNATEIPDDESL